MIISITGKIGSGKDTIAEIIQQSTQLDWEVKKFAGKLKTIAELLCGVPKQNFESQEFKKTQMSEEWGNLRYLFLVLFMFCSFFFFFYFTQTSHKEVK